MVDYLTVPTSTPSAAFMQLLTEAAASEKRRRRLGSADAELPSLDKPMLKELAQGKTSTPGAPPSGRGAPV